jgi:hypothetical protein
MRPPSGANTALVTSLVWPWRVTSSVPSRPHNRAVPSSEAVRMRPPSGANTGLWTVLVCPWRVASGLPSRSHSRALLSSEAVRMTDGVVHLSAQLYLDSQ